MTTHRRRPDGAIHPRRPSEAPRIRRPSEAIQPRRPSPPRQASEETPPNPAHLLSGYATETLSRTEQRRLYRAALDDQEIFDRLVEEESWRKVLSAPGVRQELLQALVETPAETADSTVLRPDVVAALRSDAARAPIVTPGARRREAPGGIRGWLSGRRGSRRGSGRYVPPMVMGTAAAALLAIALIPRWSELGVTDRGVAGEGAVASTERVAGHKPIQETPINDFVPKSFGGTDPEGVDPASPPASSTRGLRPKSMGGVLNLAYALELNQRGGSREVSEDWVFRARDQFRLRLDLDFDAWLYLFNRATGEAVYTVLYPLSSSEHRALPSSAQDVVLPADTWLTMDATPEDEQLILVISTEPWPFAAGRETIPTGELDAALAEAESRFASLNWRRSEVGERVKLAIEDSGSSVVVLRLLGG